MARAWATAADGIVLIVICWVDDLVGLPQETRDKLGPGLTIILRLIAPQPGVAIASETALRISIGQSEVEIPYSSILSMTHARDMVQLSRIPTTEELDARRGAAATKWPDNVIKFPPKGFRSTTPGGGPNDAA